MAPAGQADNSKINVEKLKSKNVEPPSAGCSDTPSPLRGTGPCQGESITRVLARGTGPWQGESFMHRCLILDPAVGTGTFLYAVIAQIRKTLDD